MSVVFPQADLEVRARKTGAAARPVTIEVRELSGIPFAAEGDTPYSVAAEPVNIACVEKDTLKALLKYDEIEVSIFINGELAFLGFASAPYGVEEINLVRTYRLIVKPRILDNTVEITDSRTAGKYPYIYVHEAVELILDAAGVAPADQIIAIPALEFDSPIPQIINRATVDLADANLAYTTSRPVSNAVIIGDYLYIGIGEFVIALKDAIWYKVAQFGSGFEVRALAVDSSDLICRLFYDDEVYDETITPAPSLDEWTIYRRPASTPYPFYGDGYDVEAFTTRWRTYGETEEEAYWATRSLGYAPPSSTKEAGVPDIWPRGECEVEKSINPGAYSVNVESVSDPDEIGLIVGNLISITGHNAEHLGKILNVEYDQTGYYYIVVFERRTEHFHGAGETVYFYRPSDYMQPNLLFTRFEKIHLTFEDENQNGGRYQIIYPHAIRRIAEKDIINEYYKPITVEPTDKDIQIPAPGWYAFMAESDLEDAGDHSLGDLPRLFYLGISNRTPIPREKVWKVEHPELERYHKLEYQTVVYDGTTVLTVDGRIEFDGDYCVYEDYLYDAMNNVVPNLTFNLYDGSRIRMLYRYRKNTDYAGKPYVELTGNIKYYDGKIYGCGRQITREYLPLHSRIIGAANPRDADEEIPDDANVKGVAILVLEGDLTEFLTAGKSIKIAGDTTTEPDGQDFREFDIIEVASGLREFKTGRVVTRSDISFHHVEDRPDYIYTTDGDFGGKFTVGEIITVEGSDDNDGTYEIAVVTTHSLKTWSTLTNEAAGDEITITGESDDLVKCSGQEWQFDGEWDGNIDYSGYVTWAMITPVDPEGVPGGFKAEFCGRYVWFENRRIERAVLIEYDTEVAEGSDPLTLNVLTLNTDTEHALVDRQARERAGVVGVEPELLEDESDAWPHGNVFKLANEPDISSIEVYRAGLALNVEDRSAYNNVPEPALDTCYVVENKGNNRNETWLYVKGETIRAKYDYYPNVEITAVWELDAVVYFADSEGYIYDTDGNEYGNAGGVVDKVLENDDEIYYTTRDGLLGYFGKEPPAVAADFGGAGTVVSFLGSLARQSLSTCYEFAGRVYFATGLTEEPSAWALLEVATDDAMPAIAVEIQGNRGGDIKALEGVEMLSAPYASTPLAERLAAEIFDEIENRRLVTMNAKAENPQSVLGQVEHRGITYKILGILFSGSGTENDLSLRAAVAGVAGEARGMKVGTIR